MQLSPMIAATLMFVSSISVVASSYLLNRFKRLNYNSTGSEILSEKLTNIRVVDGQTSSLIPIKTPFAKQQPSPEPLSPEVKSKSHISETIDWQPLRVRHVSISGHSDSDDGEIESDNEDESTKLHAFIKKDNKQIELVGLLSATADDIDHLHTTFPTTNAVSQKLKNKINSFRSPKHYSAPLNSSPLVTDEP